MENRDLMNFLVEFRQEIREEFAAVRKEMQHIKTELREEIQTLRVEIDNGFAILGNRINGIEKDATEHLLSSPANRARLLESLAQHERSKQ